MSLGKLVPKRRWRQARNEKRAEHIGIHGNPESGNHPGTITLIASVEIESVEILTNPHTYHDWGGGGGMGEGGKSMPQADSLMDAECTPSHLWKASHISPAKPCM